MLDAQLDMEDPCAANAFRKMKNGLVKGLSIGFSAIKTSWEEIEGKMIRHIGELKLWEVSVVTFPALPAAQVTRVKAAATDPDVAALIEIAVQKRLSALPAASTTPPEPVNGTEAATSAAEPVIVHSDISAAQNIQIRGLMQWNRPNLQS